MKKEQYFNFMFNEDEKLGFGKGYYLYFQSMNGEDLFSKYYPVEKINKGQFEYETISTLIFEDIRHNTELGWTFNPYYKVDLEKEFKVRED